MLRKGTLLSDEAVRKHCIQNLGSREGVRLDRDGVIRFTRATTDQQIVNLDAHRTNDYETVRRMIIDKDEEARLERRAEREIARQQGEVALTKRSNAYRVYNQQMREYMRLLNKGVIDSLPPAPDADILKHNRMRAGTAEVIEAKTLKSRQKKFGEYIDANSRLTEDEKNSMFINFNLNSTVKPRP
eukprot:1439130-Pleurochrysis_carterae.AAC.1